VRRSLRWVGPGEVVLVVPEPEPAAEMLPAEAAPPANSTSG